MDDHRMFNGIAHFNIWRCRRNRDGNGWCTYASVKIVQFSILPPTLSICAQNSSTPLTLYFQFQMNPSSLSLSISLSLSLQMIANQLKENIMQGWLFMSSGSSFRSAFVFSINSLILSGFPLTSFHLAEASLSAFSWLYSLVCAAIQKYHEMSFFYNYSHF